MSNVVRLPVITRLDMPASVPLEGALEENLRHVIIIGETPDGEFFFASSRADGPDVLWDLERAKLLLMQSGGALPE